MRIFEYFIALWADLSAVVQGALPYTQTFILVHFPIQHGETFEHLGLGLCVLSVQRLAERSSNAQTGPMGIPVIQTQVIYLHFTRLHVTKQMLLLSRAEGCMQYPSDSACVRGGRDLPDKPYGTFIYKVVSFEMYCLRTLLSNNCVVYKHKIVLIWWEV